MSARAPAHMNMKITDELAELNEELLAIAQAFLERHESEGEAGDQVLFCRAVRKSPNNRRLRLVES